MATDEGDRLNKNKDGRVIRYPLVEFGLSEADALKYCYDLGFDWGGLYGIKKRLSCWCCPLQNLDDLRYLYNHRPELWQELKNLDSVSYRSVKPNATRHSIQGMITEFGRNNTIRLLQRSNSPLDNSKIEAGVADALSKY